MHVLMVNTVPTNRNGITNVIMNIVSFVKNQNIHFDLLTINKPDQRYIDIFQKHSGKVYIIKRDIPHLGGYMIQLSRLIKKNKYDIVHIHGNSHLLVLDLMGAVLGGCKIRIVHSHNMTGSYPLLHKILSPLFYLLCTNYIACSQSAGKWMFGNRAFLLINNGIYSERYVYDIKNRDLVRRKYHLGNSFVIGNVGGFTAQKNQIFIIDILQELRKKNGKYSLLLLGDGETRTEISEKVQKLGLSKEVIFAGSVDNTEKYLSAFDLFVMPSLFEGLPLALIEAQANGLRCVVSDIVTDESNLSGDVRYVPLECSASEWAEVCYEVLNQEINRPEESRINILKINDAGFGISKTVDKFEAYYKSL